MQAPVGGAYSYQLSLPPPTQTGCPRSRPRVSVSISSFLARKKKLAEKNKATPTKLTKPTRRGNSAGLREVERTILKENKMI